MSNTEENNGKEKKVYNILSALRYHINQIFIKSKKKVTVNIEITFLGDKNRPTKTIYYLDKKAYDEYHNFISDLKGMYIDKE